MASTSDRTIFRDGKAILKTHWNGDGSVTVYKPFVIKPMHIMDMTGAPGWDKRAVDEVFDNFVTGTLTFTYELVHYSISIEDFRAHAFVKEIPPFGEQYHVSKRHWHAERLAPAKRVSPLRGTAIAKPTFGELVPCSRCKGQRVAAKTCGECDGVGYTRWQPQDAR